MVQLLPESGPAAGQVAVGAASVDSQALTEDAIDVPAEADLDPGSLPSGFAGPQPLASESDADQVSSPLPPDWQSERTQRSRQIGMIVALSLASLLGALLFFGWFVRSWQRETASNATVENAIDAAEPTPTETERAEAETTAVDPEAPVETATAEEPTETTTVTEQKVTEQAPPIDQAAADQPQTLPTEPATATPSATGNPSDLSGLLPTSPLDDLGPAAAATDRDNDPDASQMERLPDALRSKIAFLNLDGEPAKPTLQAPPTLDEVKMDQPTEENLDPMLVATPPEEINLRRAGNRICPRSRQWQVSLVRPDAGRQPDHRSAHSN